jgi:hypothetical protein
MYSSATRNTSSKPPRGTTIRGYSLGHSTSHHSILETGTTASISSIHSHHLLQMPFQRSRYSYAYLHHRKNANYKLSSLPALHDQVSTWTQAVLSRYLEHYSDTLSHSSSRRHESCIRHTDYTTKSDWRSIPVQSLVVKQPKTLGMHLRMTWRD